MPTNDASSAAGREIALRLNRKLSERSARGRHARVTHHGQVPFGPALRIEHFRLGNGLTVLLLADRTAPVVSYHTWYRVGSRYEEPGKTGLAHFFEHMMFQETETLPYGEFDRLMEEAGGETNAATWIDWTYYYESLPADELALAIRLESDRMAHLVVRKPQVESEREVVANERRMAVEDDVHGMASERLHSLAYGAEHPHGWPTIGWMRDIENYRVPDCRSFYRTWYAPNNATLIVVGAFDYDETLAAIQEAYGGFAPSRLPDRPPPPPVHQRRERRETIAWPTPSEKLTIGWHAPPFASFDHAVAEVIDEVLTGGRSSRLRRRLVDDTELASEIRGGISGLQHGGLFELSLSMREGRSADDALSIIDDELSRLTREPVPDAELEKVKNRIELFFLSEIETTGGKATQIGFSHTVADDPGHGFRRLEELRRVRAEDVSKLAARMLRPNRRSIVHVRPRNAA